MTHQEILRNLQWRYATKSFDPSRKITPDLWTAIEDTLVLTPSSFGLQPWKFIVITDQEKKEQLLEHSWNQRQIVDCSHLVVFCAHSPLGDQEIDTFLDRTVELRGGERESLLPYRDMMSGFVSRMSEDQLLTWSKHQVYIALGQLMTVAASLEIDACPMEGISPDQYDKLLGLEDTTYHATVACPLGYRSPEDKYATLPKVRYEKEQVISHF